MAVIIRLAFSSGQMPKWLAWGCQTVSVTKLTTVTRSSAKKRRASSSKMTTMPIVVRIETAAANNRLASMARSPIRDRRARSGTPPDAVWSWPEPRTSLGGSTVASSMSFSIPPF